MHDYSIFIANTQSLWSPFHFPTKDFTYYKRIHLTFTYIYQFYVVKASWNVQLIRLFAFYHQTILCISILVALCKTVVTPLLSYHILPPSQWYILEYVLCILCQVSNLLFHCVWCLIYGCLSEMKCQRWLHFLDDSSVQTPPQNTAVTAGRSSSWLPLLIKACWCSTCD